MKSTAVAMIVGTSVLAAGMGEADQVDVLALEAKVREIAATTPLWPAFDPLEVPLAVFDGSNTYLFRYPGVPDGFVRRGDHAVYAGRHPLLVASTTVSIEGVSTAAFLLDGSARRKTLGDLAAEAVHEAFHVFQSGTGRRWGADEIRLLLYPIEDAGLLVLRRLETEALRRALLAHDDPVAAGWAKQALEVRRIRFARLDSAFVSYERGIEAMEGTVMYVEHRAAGRSAPELPPAGFPVEAIRRRAYSTGMAWELLLDRLRPAWREGFAQDDSRYADQDLRKVLRRVPEAAGCRFSPSERKAVEEMAQADLKEWRTAREALKRHFKSAPGWRLVVEADSLAPLWPRGFDPMNIRRLDGVLLHTRFLRLGNDDGNFEVMGDSVLTEPFGPHPLFNGIRRAVVCGLVEKPNAEVDGGAVAITLESVKLRFERAVVESTGRTIEIRLNATSQ